VIFGSSREGTERKKEKRKIPELKVFELRKEKFLLSYLLQIMTGKQKLKHRTQLTQKKLTLQKD
jgi:hypothetical protein